MSVDGEDPGESEMSSASVSVNSGTTPGLSKSQIKKLAKEAMLREMKPHKKTKKQSSVLEEVLSALDTSLAALPSIPLTPLGVRGDSQVRGALKRRLCDAFGTLAYQDLPLAFGPRPEEGVGVLRTAMLRPQKYEAKYLPQEYSLLYKVWTMCGADADHVGVIDVGAGNANLAVLASALLGFTVFCVERDSPRVELRAESRLTEKLRKKVVRIERDIVDFGPEDLQAAASAHGLRRVVLMAKHPCGIGADRSIECVARLLKAQGGENGPVILGAVIATCCTTKLAMDDFKDSRVAEFCSLYAGYVTGGAQMAAFERVVDVISRNAAWRTTAESFNSAVKDEQVAWAESFEDAVQCLRLRRLQELFEHVTVVRFAPRSCTLQDRCLLACREPLSADCDDTSAFVERLRLGVGALGAPVDCTPHGFKSAKFDFDYTDE